MKNEIGRKLTSLTLMTIMVAGAAALALTGSVPSAAAQTSDLTVSAADAGMFFGPQVVEIVVQNDAIDSQEDVEGVPIVTIGGDRVLMTQNTDGAWYAYVGHMDITDFNTDSNGLTYGTTCTKDTLGGDSLRSETGAVGFICNDASISDPVISEPKSVTRMEGSVETGQIALANPGLWPFIQLYDFTEDDSVDVVYDKAGGDETVELSYERFDGQSASRDRDSYPLNAEVFFSITDHQLNIDPTGEDTWTWSFTDDVGVLQYGDSRAAVRAGQTPDDTNLVDADDNNTPYFEENGIIIHVDLLPSDSMVVIAESEDNSGVFEAWTSSDEAELRIPSDADRGTSLLIEYDSSYGIIIEFEDANLTLDASVLDGAWTSGVQLPVTLTDADFNLDSMTDDDFSAVESDMIPFIRIGEPITLGTILGEDNVATADRLDLQNNVITLPDDPNSTEDPSDMFREFMAASATGGNATSYVYVNYDISQAGTGLEISSGNVTIFDSEDAVGYERLTTAPPGSGDVTYTVTGTANGEGVVYIDLFRFGLSDDTDEATRYNDAIYRLELEETTSSSSTYAGTIEYVMINQINVFDLRTYNGVTATSDEVTIIVHEDLTGTDAISVSYDDFGSTGSDRFESAQEDAPTYSGVVEFDSDTYKVGDTVTVTVTDADLNTDVETRQSYTITENGRNADAIAADPADITAANGPALLLEVTLDDDRWRAWGGCGETGFAATTMTLLETTASSGVFTGTFDVPTHYCDMQGVRQSATGVDLGVSYVDFRDDSGNVIEVDDSVGIRANTGSVSLDRTVYPVPFGAVGAASFPLHSTAGDILPQGDLTVYATINDPDFDVSANGIDQIAEDNPVLTVEISRGSMDTPIVAAAAGDRDNPISETAPDTGIFEHEFTLNYIQGVEEGTDTDTDTIYGARECPDTAPIEYTDAQGNARSKVLDTTCILQGDILTVTYADPTDAAGEQNTVTDSATFDLRTGALQTDKSVYIIGSDMIITLIDQDLDLDSGTRETYDLNLIEWDDADTGVGLGNWPGFSATPDALRETGDNTGIFQTVIEIPEVVGNAPNAAGDALERGEEINLEYTDWSPSGAEWVGDDGEDIGTSVFTSNFGATIELDQKVYSWTDKVFITIVAPDHNFDPDNVDEIGETGDDPIRIATRSAEIEDYRLVETGADTGIFSGEVILIGYNYDADGDGTVDGPFGTTSEREAGPTDGLLETNDDDGITVSFEFSPDETVVGSALVRWNIAEVQWLESSYPATGTGTVRIVDPDMNWNPESIDNFNIDLWSDSDVGGIDLTVTETNQATGIFEGTVFFTTTDISDGHRLRVAEGDTVTASYEDHTLPEPDAGDSETIAGTALIGTVVPPLERVIVGGERVVDSFGNALASVTVDQQVQVTADLMSNQDRQQDFAYLLQIQDGNGVTVSLAWIEGALAPGQSFSPAQSWIPTAPGTYDATVFVWESVGNPTALAPQTQLSITVS